MQTYRTAVVLAAGPTDRLRNLKTRVRRATSAVLGPRHVDFHRNLFWPHVSLGYVNRTVDPRTAGRLLRELPDVDAEIGVDAVTLAAVTRCDRGYRWDVAGQVSLSASAPQLRVQ
jgi:2'-5' RNA ligase